MLMSINKISDLEALDNQLVIYTAYLVASSTGSPFT